MRAYKHTLLSHSLVVLAITCGLLSYGPQILGVAGNPIALDTPSDIKIPRDGSDGIGNPDAAADVYGLGVRLGFYLQGFTQLLHIMPLRKDSGRGVKLACASIAISILASWSILAGNKLISPCEAFLVTFILNSVSLPAGLAILNPDAIVGEGIGLMLFMITLVWTNVATTWTYAKLWHTLPLLDTQNVVFFFAPVSVTGGFRIFALLMSLLSWLLLLAEIPVFVIIGKTALRCYFKGMNELSDEDRKRLKKSELAAINMVIMPLLKRIKPKRVLGPEFPTGSPPDREETQRALRKQSWLLPICLLPAAVFAWALLIVMSEKTISLNNLSPATDLSAPGQLIPLVAGLSVALDSVFFIFRPSSGEGGSVEQFRTNVNKIRHMRQKFDHLDRLSGSLRNEIRFDEDLNNVMMKLMPKINLDMTRAERVLRDYKILGEHSEDMKWRKRIQKALRKMTWNQDKVQGYLDSLTSNVSQLEITIAMCVRAERLRREILDA